MLFEKVEAHRTVCVYFDDGFELCDALGLLLQLDAEVRLKLSQMLLHGGRSSGKLLLAIFNYSLQFFHLE